MDACWLVLRRRTDATRAGNLASHASARILATLHRSPYGVRDAAGGRRDVATRRGVEPRFCCRLLPSRPHASSRWLLGSGVCTRLRSAVSIRRSTFICNTFVVLKSSGACEFAWMDRMGRDLWVVFGWFGSRESVGWLISWFRPRPPSAPVPLTLALSRGGERGCKWMGLLSGKCGLVFGLARHLPSPGIPRSLRSRPFRPTKGATVVWRGAEIGVLAVWLAGRPQGIAPTICGVLVIRYSTQPSVACRVLCLLC